MGLLNRAFARVIGVPREPTGYQPRISPIQTNIGAACWRFDVDSQGARLYAPRLPPLQYLIIGVVVSLVMIGGVAGLYVAIRSSGDMQNARVVLAIGWLPLLLGLSGVWIGMLWGNRKEAKRGPVLRCDATASALELPRNGTRFAKADLVRFELVSFCVTMGGPQKTTVCWNRHLVLVRRDPKTGERFEVLLPNGSPQKKIAAKLGSYFGVPERATCAGNYKSDGTKLPQL